MTFEQAMEYLRGLTKFGMNFGLGRITELLRRLGNPQEGLAIVHIGGTNGKGSTGVMIAAVLETAGYRVGSFTSPHLHAYTERYRINGQDIAPREVAALVSMLRPHLDAMVREGFEHPTEFEVSTAMAFCYFRQQNVDLLLLEVGLGGLIDSTNVITKPLVTVITNVSKDHMDYLGHTIAEIASVKAGIIKKGVPLVTAARDTVALEIIQQACRENNAPLVLVGRDVGWEAGGQISLAGQGLHIKGMRGDYRDLWLPLLGRQQLENAATALAVIELLCAKGFSVSTAALRAGLKSIHWPARMEIASTDPLVLIDVAHNHEGAKCLRRLWDDYFPGRQVVLVIGMLEDKEQGKVAAELAPRARLAIVTRPDSPRAGAWQQLAREIRPLAEEVRVIEEIKEAVVQGIAAAGPRDLVCITGSFYMVARAREYFVGSRGDQCIVK